MNADEAYALLEAIQDILEHQENAACDRAIDMTEKLLAWVEKMP